MLAGVIPTILENIMATDEQRLDLKTVLKTSSNPTFVSKLTERFDEIFKSMNLINKMAFSKYDQFVGDVQSFQTALLKYVLEAQGHLSGLMNNMLSKGFQKASEEKRLAFIESRLNRINTILLLDYLTQCRKLIKTSVELHDEYGTTKFKVKYVLCNILGFTVIGATVGFTLGWVLPLCSLMETAIGGAVGAFAGLAFATYELLFKWEKKMGEVQEIRDNLQRIHDALVDVEKQLFATHKQIVESQMESKGKLNGDSFLEIEELQQYVSDSYDQFVKLEKTLLNVKFRIDE